MNLLAPSPPVDLESFWNRVVFEADSHPLEFEVKAQSEQYAPDHIVNTIEFTGISGQVRHGWVALPKRFVQPVPGFLWVPPYSRWSMLPNQYGTRPGFASLSFNFFGESAFHQEVYKPERGYFAEGIESPETWIFREMAQNAIVASRILESLPEVDSNRLASMGMSQGGGISIWLGAFLPRIRAVVADMPFLGGMRWALDPKNVYRYPLKEVTDVMALSPQNEAMVRKTISYFDTVNVGSFCQKPTRVTLGLRDPAVKPEQARAVFEALAGEKELEEIDFGHDWHPQMVSGGTEWLKRHLT